MIHEIDPLTDNRWQDVLSQHRASASVFHTHSWIEAIQRTYGYGHIAITTSAAGGTIHNAILVCRVPSWVTGRRLVSLSFSDHCEPLIASPNELSSLTAHLVADVKAHRCKYIEIRPLNILIPPDTGLAPSQSFCHHTLHLTASPSDLFLAFHKDCIQRKIRRAERERLTCEEGRSPELLRKFYHLQILTRRRQQIPPQPFAWFRNLAECMGEKLTIRVASKDGNPVASILTLQHRRTLVYKYGCSDKAYSNLGGMPLLFWRAIQSAKAEGLSEFDLGRSDWENEGLIQFKDRLGAKRHELTYWRYPAAAAAHAGSTWKMKVAKRVFSLLPHVCQSAAGNLLYKHVG